MFIYGTIGVFVRYIPLPSPVIAMTRGIVGSIFLGFVILIRRQKINFSDIRRNLLYLCISGAILGINWILLFEAYRFTSVATATLCYYLSPIMLVAVSPFIFKEKMTARKLTCIVVALIGMVFVSGILNAGISGISELRGIMLALCAAVLYTCIVTLNKMIKGISPYDKTLLQLAISALVLLPYNLFSGSFSGAALSPLTLVLLLIVGAVHTGLAYYLYFGSLGELPSQTLAILSYIDPVIAVLLSALLLHERIGIFGIIGAVLILGSALVSELPEKEKTEN